MYLSPIGHWGHWRYYSGALLAAAWVLLCGGCRTAARTNAPNPGEQYLTEVATSPPLSSITLPIAVPVRQLVDALNRRTQGLLYEDNSFSDNGGDGLMLRLWRTQSLEIALLPEAVRYRVPLKVWLKKQLLWEEVEIEGELELGLKTTFDISPDWSLRTQTAVEFHEWHSAPKLKTALGDINLQLLANLMLQQSKASLAQTLDRLLQQQVNLRYYAQMAWEALQKPVLLDTAQQLWVKTTPLSIGMLPLITAGDELRTVVSISGHSEVVVGEPPALRPSTALPLLQRLSEAKDEFIVRLSVRVPFAEAERRARALTVGQVFSSGKKQVTVQNVRLWGNGDRLVINTTLSGFFNGEVYLIGRPMLNAAKNCIEIIDLDFHAETRNVLHRTAAWLFSSSFERRIQQALVFPLEENLQALRSSAQQSLREYVIQPGVVLHGTVDTLAVERTRITSAGICADLFTKGQARLKVNSL